MPVNPIHIFTYIEEIQVLRPVEKINWTKCGDLWLRIADQRDIFFASSVELNSQVYDTTHFGDMPKPSLGQGQKWFDGTKDEFLSIDVDNVNTIIEGFYEDSEAVIGEYEVTIYLEIEL